MVDQEVLQHKINIVENNLTKMETLAALFFFRIKKNNSKRYL
jgi:hypothetical protein